MPMERRLVAIKVVRIQFSLRRPARQFRGTLQDTERNAFCHFSIFQYFLDGQFDSLRGPYGDCTTSGCLLLLRYVVLGWARTETGFRVFIPGGLRSCCALHPL